MLISEIRWSPLSRAILMAGMLVHFTILVVASRGQLWPLLLLYPFLIFVLSVFQTVRARLDGHDLRVGFRLFAKRIPLHTIDRVEPVIYRWLQWGGWGVRYRRGSVLYNVPGDHGRAVELTLHGGKRVLFSAENPDAVAMAIREQRAMMPY